MSDGNGSARKVTLGGRVRDAWGRLQTRGRFRDPVADFDLGHDYITQYDVKPAATGPNVHTDDAYVSLHMVGDVHSVMSRDEPDRLMLSYTGIMMGFTRFVRDPHTVGMIGLGGGSLVKACYRRLPRTRIIVAENSADVIAMRGRFHIPEDDERLQVLLMDGAEMVRSSHACFDALFVDAFDEAGYPLHLATTGFYQACFESLTDDGVLAINLCGGDWRTWFRRMDRVFGGRVVLYQCPDGNNVIAFAAKRALPEWMQQRPS